MSIAISLLAGTSQADEKTERKKLSDHVAKEVTRLQLRKIYVSDFLDASGVRTDKGCYFASVFSTNLKEQSKDFEVLDRIDAQKFLDIAGISASELQKAEFLSKMNASLGMRSFRGR